MRSLFLRAGICLLLLLPAAAWAEGERPHSEALQANCNIESDYRLQVDAGGVRLEADDDADEGLPGLIAISGGTLRLDGAPQAVSEADAERLRGIEAGVRGMLPDMTAIAREAIAITFDALGGVNAALGGKRSGAQQFQQMREDALARVDVMEARGEWSSELFGEEFEAEVEAAAEAMAESFTPHAGDLDGHDWRFRPDGAPHGEVGGGVRGRDGGARGGAGASRRGAVRPAGIGAAPAGRDGAAA